MVYKTCPKCKKTKPIALFSLDRSQADGLQSRCKECRRIAQAEWLATHGEQMRQAQARWRAAHPGYTTEVARANPARHCERAKKYRTAHPDRVKAHNAARYVAAAPCSVCGSLRAEKHHPDYSKPTLVVHLCKKCHTEKHRATV
jgi:hypothetical protein